MSTVLWHENLVHQIFLQTCIWEVRLKNCNTACIMRNWHVQGWVWQMLLICTSCCKENGFSVLLVSMPCHVYLIESVLGCVALLTVGALLSAAPQGPARQ